MKMGFRDMDEKEQDGGEIHRNLVRSKTQWEFRRAVWAKVFGLI